MVRLAQYRAISGIVSDIVFETGDSGPVSETPSSERSSHRRGVVTARVAVRNGATDEELMRRVQDTEDVEAFSSLYDRHATRAYRIARSVCGDSSRSEEAVQEGFLSIWRGRAKFRPVSGSFQAWSMSIVRYAAIDALRRDRVAKRPRLVEQGIEPADSRAASPEEQVVAGSEAEAVRASLTQLPEAQAEVITLAFFGDLSHSEIAQALDLPPGTVKGRMRLGLEKLRSQMGPVA